MSRLIAHDRRQLKKYPSLVGIDEAGRGCLAGPVSAGAVWFDREFLSDRKRAKAAGAINDSKKLSPAAREAIFEQIQSWIADGVLAGTAQTANVTEIDVYNILGATRLAMSRCLKTLADAHPGPCPFAGTGDDTPLFSNNDSEYPLVLADGRPLKPFAWRHTALVKGDGRSLAVAMASVSAKVSRDRLMKELDKMYPQYGYAIHKGYATPEHIAAIKKHGPCPEHRPLFLRSILSPSEDAGDAHPEFSF